MKHRPPPCVLTIAGSDSGGGAGVQADARTIHALGGFACMAITAITAQNTHGVTAWRAERPAMIVAQIEAVLGRRIETTGRLRRRRPDTVGGATANRRATNRTDAGAHGQGVLPVRAIKTGLIPGAAAVRAIAAALGAHPTIPLVVDPVIGSTSGTPFLDHAGLRALKRELLPRATIVTPNWPEAEALSGIHLRSFTDAERAAREIAAGFGGAVLLKGGHAPGSVCRDCLVTADGQVHWFESRRIATANTHGTGCVLAAAIATELALGQALDGAIARARTFLQASLQAHRRTSWRGAGPAFPGL